MTEHDDLLGNAQLIREAREYEDAAQPGDSQNWIRLVDLASRLADAALETRPSLVVRGEEELAKGLFRLNYTADSYNMYGWYAAVSMTREHYMARARALIAKGTVTVAPSLVAESREAVEQTVYEAMGFDISHERAGRVADALLAPAGPVRVADATPEQGWRRAVEYLGSLLGAVRDVDMDAALSANPYDGFTRREQNDGE